MKRVPFTASTWTGHEVRRATDPDGCRLTVLQIHPSGIFTRTETITWIRLCNEGWLQRRFGEQSWQHAYLEVV